MKYFRLGQDDREDQYLTIKGLINLPCFQQIKQGDISGLPKSNSYMVVSSYSDKLPNILTNQLFMVTQDIFALIQLFLGEVDYRCMFLVNRRRNIEKFYYIPQLPLINCLSSQCKSNLDKSHFTKIVIKRERYPDIFRISNVKDRVIIISLPLAESILRRDIKGVQLEQIWLEE